MNPPSAEDVIEAFARVVRTELVDGESIRVPGLGTFLVEHRPSEMKDLEDDAPRMVPPRDVVQFTPDD